MKPTQRFQVTFAALASAVFLWSCNALERPDLKQYEKYAFNTPVETTVSGDTVATQMNVTFLGTSSLYFNDGKTGVLVDGFFTRPGNIWQLLFGTIQSDHAKVKRYLDRLNIKKLDAIPVFHSHYDHAMDSAEIARLTGATVIGSESTAQIMRGEKLSESQISVNKPYQAHQFGDFTITLIPSQHVPLPGVVNITGMMGDVDQPLTQPASMFAFAEGETYAIHIAHPLGNSMVHSGAFLPGELTQFKDKKYPVDTLFQCTPGLQKLKPAVQQQYLKEIILDTGVKRVVPVHWDDFTHSLDEPLVPLPQGAEDMEAAMHFLEVETAPRGIEIGFLPAWQSRVLYAHKKPEIRLP